MDRFFRKYYTKEVKEQLLENGFSIGMIYQGQSGYYVPRPSKIIKWVQVIAEIYNLDPDKLLWECICSFTGDKYE